jgi:hypothetical protein
MLKINGALASLDNRSAVCLAPEVPIVSSYVAGARIVLVMIRVLPWVVIAVLAFNMSQRAFMAVGVGKRFATLQMALLVAALWAATLLFPRLGIGDVFLIPVVALLVAVAVLRRRSIFPHRLRCSSCRVPLGIKRILYHDDTRCAACAAAGDAPERTP